MLCVYMYIENLYMRVRVRVSESIFDRDVESSFVCVREREGRGLGTLIVCIA